MDIEDHLERLLQAPRRNLERARRDPATRTQLACEVVAAQADRRHDRNYAARLGVLWSLQYDRQPEDSALLRFLLEQQIAFYIETAPFGMSPDLTLAGFLLAEHRQVEDLWLHWQAKNISFDTALGYHRYHLLTAGIEATATHVRASAHPDRDRILETITAAQHSDEAVEQWLAQQREAFPADPTRDDLKAWSHRAATLGEPETARLFLLAWADAQPHAEKTLNTLQYHLARLGYLPEAITAQEQAMVLAGSSSPTMTTSRLLTLARLQRQVGDISAAWQTMHECENALPPDKNGFSQGTWRHFVKECFLLIPATPDPDTARRALQAADQHLNGIPRLWMDGILAAATAAAEHLHDADLLHHYQALQHDAHRERDAEISLVDRRT
jgi:hypothetical protein